MPYISKESVKVIREKLKNTFPEFKFSVTCSNYSSVNVNVMAGPIDFGSEYSQVNHFWIDEHWKEKPKAKKFLLAVDKIMNSCNDGSGHEDVDYGFIPSYYRNISIGKWDKPYVKK